MTYTYGFRPISSDDALAAIRMVLGDHYNLNSVRLEAPDMIVIEADDGAEWTLTLQQREA